MMGSRTAMVPSSPLSGVETVLSITTTVTPTVVAVAVGVSMQGQSHAVLRLGPFVSGEIALVRIR